MAVTFTGVNAPIRYIQAGQFRSISVEFTAYPLGQRVYPAPLPWVPPSPGVTTSISPRYPKLGNIRIVDMSNRVRVEIFDLEFPKNIYRTLESFSRGFELWIRPGCVCNVVVLDA